ncbi:hypothetical protein [Acidocella sp.]|jgi:hypothetical protein|uniref:hypothetical protein n=1 Tax=Acidocella sp. TaxID=50710 RepID=UPI0038CF99D2
MKIRLFDPCFSGAFFPEAGIATLERLERFGHDGLPQAQREAYSTFLETNR